VKLNGEVLIEDFTLSIDIDGDVTIDGGSYPKAVSSDTEGISLLAIVVVVAVIIIIIAAAVYILINRKAPVEQVEVAAIQSPGGCPNCGKQLVYMQDFGRYYCSSCNTYH
jgi:hypothetical protein